MPRGAVGVSNERPSARSPSRHHADASGARHSAAAVGVRRAHLTVLRTRRRAACTGSTAGGGGAPRGVCPASRGTTGAGHTARAARARGRWWAARPLRRSQRLNARRTAAAVSVDGAGAARRNTRLGVAMKDAGRVGHARRVIAAIVGAGAGIARLPARIAQRVASRYAESIELTAILACDAAAAIVSRRRDTAGVILVVADVALGVAAGRVATDADRPTRRLVADYVAVAREAGAGGAATVAVFSTQIAVHTATRRRLAYRDARGTVRRAEPAAAPAAIVARRAVHLAAAVARPSRRRRTRAGARAGGDVAHLRAAIRPA
jgi:hypothetical protein